MDPSVFLEIGADSSDLQREMTKSSKALDAFEDEARKAERGGADLAKTLTKIGDVSRGITAIKGAFDMVAGAIGDFFSEALEAQRGTAQLEARLESTGHAAGMTKTELLDLAGSLSASNGLSRASDDAVLAAENMLLTFTNIKDDVFPATTQAVLDVATAMNQGAAPSAEQLSAQAVQLGKALNDPAEGLSALTKIGVTFSEGQKAQIKTMQEHGDMAGAQKLILEELAREFGGSASASAKTFEGRLDSLKAKFADVQQDAGERLLPMLDSVVTAFSGPETMGAVQMFADMIVGGVQMAGDAIGALQPIVAPVFQFLKENSGATSFAVQAMFAAIAIAAIAAAVPTVIALAPILAVLAAVGAAAFLLYTAWNSNFLGIQQIVEAVAEAVGAAIGWIGDALDWLQGKAKDAGPETGQAYADGLYNGVQSGADRTQTAAEQIATAMDQSATAGESGTTTGFAYADSTVDAMQNGQPDAERAASDMASSLDTSSAARLIGSNLASEYIHAGIVPTLDEGQPEVSSAVARVLAKLEEEDKFKETGSNNAEGYNAGFKDGVAGYYKDLDKLAVQAATAVENRSGFRASGDSNFSAYWDGALPWLSSLPTGISGYADQVVAATDKKDEFRESGSDNLSFFFDGAKEILDEQGRILSWKLGIAGQDGADEFMLQLVDGVSKNLPAVSEIMHNLADHADKYGQQLWAAAGTNAAAQYAANVKAGVIAANLALADTYDELATAASNGVGGMSAAQVAQLRGHASAMRDQGVKDFQALQPELINVGALPEPPNWDTDPRNPNKDKDEDKGGSGGSGGGKAEAPKYDAFEDAAYDAQTALDMAKDALAAATEVIQPFATAVEDAQGRVDGLQREIQLAERGLRPYEQAVKDAGKALDSAKEQLAAAEAGLDPYQQEIDSAQESVHGLEIQLRHAEEALQPFKDQVAAAQTEVTRAQQALDDATAQLAPYERAVTQSGYQVADLQAEIRGATWALDPFKAEVERAGGALDQANADLQGAQTELRGYQAQLQAAQSALQGFQQAPLAGSQAFSDALFENSQKVAELQYKLNALQLGPGGNDAEIEMLRAALEHLNLEGQQIRLREQLELDPLRRELEQVGNTARELTFQEAMAGANQAAAQIQQMQAAIATTTAQVHSYEEAQARAQEQMDRANESLAQQEEGIKKLQAALEVQSRIYQSAQDNLEAMRRTLDPYKDAVNAAKDKLELANRALAEQQAALEPLNRELATQKIRLADANDAYDAANKVIEPYRTAVGEAEKAVNSANKELQIQKDKLDPLYAALQLNQDAVDDAKFAYGEAQKTLDPYNDAVGEAQTKLDAANEALGRHKDALDPVKSMYMGINAELREWEQHLANLPAAGAGATTTSGPTTTTAAAAPVGGAGYGTFAPVIQVFVNGIEVDASSVQVSLGTDARLRNPA